MLENKFWSQKLKELRKKRILKERNEERKIERKHLGHKKIYRQTDTQTHRKSKIGREKKEKDGGRQ